MPGGARAGDAGASASGGAAGETDAFGGSTGSQVDPSLGGAAGEDSQQEVGGASLGVGGEDANAHGGEVTGGGGVAGQPSPSDSTCPDLSGLGVSDDRVLACELLVRSQMGRYVLAFDFAHALELTAALGAIRAHALGTPAAPTKSEFEQTLADADEVCKRIAGAPCVDVFPAD
ncbi:MAG: hypothetical protein WDO74_27860 [Pseudomonadota bacterium]